MSALESLHFSTEHRHPTVIEILFLRKLERKGFDIIFPGYLDTWVYLNYVHRVWKETWDQQVLNKLHSIHPSTSHWAALPVRRHDVRLTRLRIGHTRFTHRHLLLAWPKLALAPLKLTIIILSLIWTWTVPGSLHFIFRSTSWSPYRFSLAEGTSPVLSQKSNRFLARGASQPHPQNPNLFWGALAPHFIFLSQTISSFTLLPSLVLLPPLSDSSPLISCSSAAPVGLGSLDLLSFCRTRLYFTSPMGDDV
ncbi:putative RNA-directed DNA polymerase from transposon X-element [Trichonephila clavipes]|nr:putative RNA-directed DNA polymerase from transposon X-element [Trichonephila clavipes]